MSASLKTPRYYYDDALAAAYMAKHFKMKLYCVTTQAAVDEYGGNVGDEFDWLDACPLDELGDVNTISDALSFVEDATGTVYVHPDSLALLEPRDGDKDEDGCVFCAETQSWYRKINYQPKSELVFRAKLPHESKTAKRDGKVFFWPEMEIGQ